MRDRRAGLGDMGEVVAGCPVQPAMVVEKDRMADDRVFPEYAYLAQPFDRRSAVPPHDLLELNDALRRTKAVPILTAKIRSQSASGISSVREDRFPLRSECRP
jgi:hypothetical protein